MKKTNKMNEIKQYHSKGHEMALKYRTYVEYGFWKSYHPFKMREILKELQDYYTDINPSFSKVKAISDLRMKLICKVEALTDSQMLLFKMTA